MILAKAPRKKSPPTLKILDLGLALLSEALLPDHQGLTYSGQMMGTIDYMAPEQGGDSHQVDIRADIYSLGATLYKLLTGSAPFAGEKFDTPVKKILALATLEPQPVQTRRADIPSSVAAIVHKMLAKDPAQRYATPDELIEALAPFCQGANLSALLERGTRPGQPNTSSSEAPTHPQLSSGSADTAPTIDRPIKVGTKLPSRSALTSLGRKIPRPIAIAAACGSAALVVLLGVIFYLETLKGTIRIEINDDTIKVALDEGSATFQGKGEEHSTRVQAGPHGLTITRGDLKFTTDKFELRKGETLRLSVTYLAGKVDVVDTRNGKSLVPQTANASWHGWPKDAPPPAIAPFDAKQARKHQEEWAAYLGAPLEYENSFGMKFVLIPPGEFTMGSTAAEVEASLLAAVGGPFASGGEFWRSQIRSEAPRHKVILTQPIYLGVHEVMQRQYAQVMGENPSHFAELGAGKDLVAGLDTSTHPVEMVSWNDVAEFCAKLSEKENLRPFDFSAGEAATTVKVGSYRLPTEAQWEFACRAGTTSKYWTGNRDEDLSRAGWFIVNSGDRTHPAGQLEANPFGLLDIHGNVWEWVQEWWEPTYYGQFQQTTAIDPAGPSSAGTLRLIRGGHYRYPGFVCKATHRHSAYPTSRHRYVGFRVALTVDAVKQASKMREPKRAAVTAGWHGWPKDAPAPAIAPFDAKQARKHQEEWADYLKVPVDYENSNGMKLVLIPPGEFIMGASQAEIDEGLATVKSDKNFSPDAIQASGPPHRVILSQPTYLGIHEVTQAQYEAVMGQNPSSFAATGRFPEIVDRVKGMDTSRHPVEGVSWNDAAQFCAKFSERERLAGRLVGRGYHLPTEATWEFACRAGTTSRYWSGDLVDDLTRVGWFGGNSGKRTHAVGELPPNPFGLFDMHGNLMEWCQDGWDAELYRRPGSEGAVDPAGPDTGPRRMVRGGGMMNFTCICRSATRYDVELPHRSTLVGFRVAVPVEAVKQATAHVPKASIAPFDASQAKANQEAWAKHLGMEVETTNSVGAIMVLIPPGEFLMGSTDEQVAMALQAIDHAKGDQVEKKRIEDRERPQHRVVIATPLLMGATEVTVGQFKNFVAAKGYQTSAEKAERARQAAQPTTRAFDQAIPTYLSPGYAVTDDSPAAAMTWNDAVAYCEWLSKQENATYRLPTEEEWEYACRAGTTTQYSFGDDQEKLKEYAWCIRGAGDKAGPVGTKLPNPFRLYDMHGNVLEWCLDFWDQKRYSKVLLNEPLNSATGTQRVLRGGGWTSSEPACRSAYRTFSFPASRYDGSLGFRVVRVLQTPRVSAAFTNALDMQFARIPKGKALLGGGGGKPGDKEAEFREDFFLGMYEVTLEEWEKVTGKLPSELPAVEGVSQEELKRFPVGGLCWEEARQFVDLLNEKVKEPGWIYRLPTQVEWEYACRGGPIESLDTAFDFYGDEPSLKLLPVQANFGHASRPKQPSRVGTYPPNRLGLHDMHGNVWEFCDDVLEGQEVVTPAMRGGCWDLDSGFCRASIYFGTGAKTQNPTHGLRVARVRR